MREYPYPYPWRELPGSPDELAFLERRFSGMSVPEQNIAADTERLGRYMAKYVNERQAPFMNYTEIGESMEENGHAYEYSQPPDQSRGMEMK